MQSRPHRCNDRYVRCLRICSVCSAKPSHFTGGISSCILIISFKKADGFFNWFFLLWLILGTRNQSIFDVNSRNFCNPNIIPDANLNFKISNFDYENSFIQSTILKRGHTNRIEKESRFCQVFVGKLKLHKRKSFITVKKPCALDGWPESDSNLSLCKIPDHLAPLLFCTVHNSMTSVVEIQYWLYSKIR